MTRTASQIDQKSRWVESVKRRKGWNKAAIALAKKHVGRKELLCAHLVTVL